MKPKRLLILAILLALVTAALPVASAQEPPKPTLAYIKGGNLWLRYDNNTDVALTDDAGRVVGNAAYPAYYEPRYAQPRWSPDGKWLAVVRIDRAGRTLYLADVTQPEIRLEPVVGGLGIAFPPAWNADSLLAYVVATGQYDADGRETHNVFAVSPEDPARESLLLGAFGFQVGCGGGTSDPAEALYWEETASMGGNSLAFYWIGAQIVHATNCSGAGVAVLDLNTQTDTPLDIALARVVLSDDGGFIAGVAPKGEDGASAIAIYNLDKLDTPHRVVTVATDPNLSVGHVAWNQSATGVFFSLIQLEAERTTADSMQDRALQVFGQSPVMIRVNFCGFRFYNLIDDSNSRLYTAPAHVLANIFVLDGNNVGFTQIENADVWLDLFEEGRSAADLSYNIPRQFVIVVTLDPAGSNILLEDAGQVAVRPTEP